ncbi:MAG: hypothetical protein NZX11_07050, partial [Thermus sp.]|nr:hypothetical protein [Thermus sp.]
ERAAGVPAEVAKTFRSEILALVGALAAEGEAVKWNSDPRMAKAIESIIMGDRVRVIRSTVSAIAPSEEDAETIRKVKECLTQGESYCEKCASWVLDYYAEKSRRSA